MRQICSTRGGNARFVHSHSRNNGREGAMQGLSMSVKWQLAKQVIRTFLVRILACTLVILTDVFLVFLRPSSKIP
jgi:hypothetical protein